MDGSKFKGQMLLSQWWEATDHFEGMGYISEKHPTPSAASFFFLGQRLFYGTKINRWVKIYKMKKRIKEIYPNDL